jgi:serine/threonine-protein kinase
MGERFGHYRLDELIGRGGMGDVHRAFDTVKKRTVALKLLPAHLAQDQDFQARFRREAELAARLTEPHIIPIHDYGEIAGQLFIDMRLIPGTDLAGLIRQVGPLPPARAVAIVAQVASALAAAHAERLIHRDVKPSNVLISETDRGEDFVHLVDFGVAHSEAATALTATGATIGTVDYMAPEQFEAGKIDSRVDVYALGCVLYEALTASKPFPAGGLAAKMSAHMLAPVPRPSQLRPGIPAGLDDVVAKAMAKRPDQRFASTTELAISAQQCLHGAAPVPEGGWSAPPTRPTGTNIRPPTMRADRTTTGQHPPPPPQMLPVPPAFAPAPVPEPAPRPGRRRLLLFVAVPAVALAVVATVLLVDRPSGQISSLGTAGTTSPADAGAGPVAATRIDLSGYATGTLAAPRAECTRLGGSSWSWNVKGSIGDAPLEISYTTNNWRGAAVYNTTSITDGNGGMLTVYAGSVSFISNGNDRGTLTVAGDERSGSIEADLDQSTAAGQAIHVSGSWRCA